MTLIQVEKRVKALEKTMRRLANGNTTSRNWYRTHAGRFASDPEFDEIVKLGQAYRRSLKPAAHTKRS